MAEEKEVSWDEISGMFIEEWNEGDYPEFWGDVETGRIPHVLAPGLHFLVC